MVIATEQTTLPCVTCRAECCGAVPVRSGELRRIIEALRTLPRRDVKRLASQQRDVLICPLVDTRTWRCAVYDSRPLICTLFGRVEGLQCPHVTGDRKLIKRRHANLALRVVEQEFVGVLGLDIGWPELMQMVESKG